MRVTEEHQAQINSLFHNMETSQDFYALMNLGRKHIHGKKATAIDENLVKKMASNDYISDIFKQPTSHFYTQFDIKKKSGGTRTIHAPHQDVKQLQEVLNYILQCVYEPHPAATGFVIGKSIVDNAKLHIDKKYVYNLDLKDFFPSIDKFRVYGRLLVAPFHLKPKKEGKYIANMIASISCANLEVLREIDSKSTTLERSVLPQGAPTSPTLSNAICERLDIQLAGVAKRFALVYSRYADDITFSSNHNAHEYSKGKFERIFEKDTTFDKEVRRIITAQNFRINESKVRLQTSGYKQEVTGLIVNEKLNVSRKYIKQLRMWLYYWERYGFVKASIYFTQQYLAEKGHLGIKNPNMTNVIEGKLLFLKMVKGVDDSTYTGLIKRFEKVSGRKNKIDQLLDIWEQEVTDAAIAFYNERIE